MQLLAFDLKFSIQMHSNESFFMARKQKRKSFCSNPIEMFVHCAEYPLKNMSLRPVSNPRSGRTSSTYSVLGLGLLHFQGRPESDNSCIYLSSRLSYTISDIYRLSVLSMCPSYCLQIH